MDKKLIDKYIGKDYLGGKEASEILGVHQRTLYQWEIKGYIETIRTPGGKRLYNVKKYLENIKNQIKKESELKYGDNELINDKEILYEKVKYEKLEDEDEIFKLETEEKLNICYARVSTQSQKDDLERQIKLLKKKYPDYLLIKDIGSGINYNRRGFKKIFELSIKGKINELVIVHKDRFVRFGYDFFEEIIMSYSGGKIIILEKEKDLEPEEELVMDVLQVLNVFTAKMNGLRKYKKKKE